MEMRKNFTRTAGLLLLLLAFTVRPSFALRAPDGATRAVSGTDLETVLDDGLPLAPSVPVSASQREPLRSYPGVDVVWNRETGVPQLLRGFSRIVSNDPLVSAFVFLTEIRALFRMENPRQDLRVLTVQTDDRGFRHVRLRQYYQGIPVIGSELIVHVNDRNIVYQVNGDFTPDITISAIPSIAVETASVVDANGLSTGSLPGETPRLVILPVGNRHHLAYETVRVREDVPVRWIAYVDAHTGRLLRRYNEVKYVAPPSSNGVHADITGTRLTGEGGDVVTVQGWHEDTTDADTFYLHNKNTWWTIRNSATSGWSDRKTYAFRDHTNDWATSDPVEMSAAAAFLVTQDFYKTVFGRNSFDDGSGMATGNVHYGSQYVNAYWDGSQLWFGDGDNSDASSLAVLDVVAHEYGHGWTDYTSQLIYQNESGALNESFSDISGANVEFYAQPDGRSAYPGRIPGAADWLVGEDCWLSSTALRDMRNPSNPATVGAGNEQPSRYAGTYWYSGTGDNGGVHYNSGVQNFFYYLLCEGGTGINDGLPYAVTGLGIANARQVAYRANTYYLTPSATHQTALAAWKSAAADLNGDWVASVQQAWQAAGVADIPADPWEGFETASLPAGWTTGGNANWFSATTTAVEGNRSVQAGAITNSQTSWIQWSGTVASPGIVSFFVRISSQKSGDYVTFYLDGVQRVKWSGTVAWTSFCDYLSVGTHTLKWEYKKNSNGVAGSDTCWLDAVSGPFSASPASVLISGSVKTSGGAGIAGVTMTLTDYSGTNPTTDANGDYQVEIPSGWTGRVTPSKTGYTFTPSYLDYTVVTISQSGQNYIGTPQQTGAAISGSIKNSRGVGIAGVIVMFGRGGGSTVTDANGYYSATVANGWSGRATPGKRGFTFTPAYRNYTSVVAARTDQNYTGQKP